MAQTIPDIEPSVIPQGVTTKWTRDLASFPTTDGWKLSYRFAGPKPFTLNAAASNGQHLVTLTSASANGRLLPAGHYWWQSTAASAAISESYRVGTGQLEVTPDFSDIVDSGYDGRSPYKVVLDAIDATLAQVATKAQQSISVDGRAMSNFSPGELTRMRDYYASKVAQEEDAAAQAAGKGNRRIIRTRFTAV